MNGIREEEGFGSLIMRFSFNFSPTSNSQLLTPNSQLLYISHHVIEKLLPEKVPDSYSYYLTNIRITLKVQPIYHVRDGILESEEFDHASPDIIRMPEIFFISGGVQSFYGQLVRCFLSETISWSKRSLG